MEEEKRRHKGNALLHPYQRAGTCGSNSYTEAHAIELCSEQYNVNKIKRSKIK